MNRWLIYFIFILSLFLFSCSKEKGKFGRVLATVLVVKKDGTEVDCNNQLCVEGHARAYFGGKKIPWPGT